MNHLTIATTIAAVTAALAIRLQIQLHHYRRSAAEMRDALAAQSLEESRLRAASVSQAAEANNASAAVRSAWNDLAGARADVASASPPAIDLSTEGAWPGDRPYFHLAKKYLASLGYDWVESGTRISPVAATLFGMTAGEKAEVDAALKKFRDDLSQAQRKHAELIPPTADANSDDHRGVTFLVHRMNGEFEPLAHELRGAMETALGSERGGLLYSKAEVWLSDQDSPFGNEGDSYRVRLDANRQENGTVQHMLSLGPANSDGSFNMASGVSYPVESGSNLVPFIGLFGDQPLLEDRPILK